MLGKVHHTRRTPWVSILFTTAISFALITYVVRASASEDGATSIAPSVAPLLESWGVAPALAMTLATIVLTLVIAYLSLVLGELDGPLSAIGSMRDAGRRASTPDPRRAPTAATGAPSTGERAPGPPAADGPTGGPADAQHRPLLRALGWDPVDADTLAERLASSPSDLLPALFLLELGGTVERLPDGRYVRRQ